jgi:hypothetical protein
MSDATGGRSWNVSPVAEKESESPAPSPAPSTTRPRPRRRIIRLVTVLAIVSVALLLLVYVVVPHAEIQFDRTTYSYLQGTCTRGPIQTCSGGTGVVKVGPSSYSTLFGSGNVTPLLGYGEIEVTISNVDPVNYLCANCTNRYSASASGQGSGSFDVSGTGPFYISVIPVTDGHFYTTIQGTVFTWT